MTSTVAAPAAKTVAHEGIEKCKNKTSTMGVVLNLLTNYWIGVEGLIAFYISNTSASICTSIMFAKAITESVPIARRKLQQDVHISMTSL